MSSIDNADNIAIDNADKIAACKGKSIASVAAAGSFDVTFTDGTTLKLSDEGQFCCESRYMTCDDDLASFVGAQFLDCYVDGGIEPPPLPDDSYGDYHEYAFIRILTSAGPIVVANHNEHNGYYGGFCLAASLR